MFEMRLAVGKKCGTRSMLGIFKSRQTASEKKGVSIDEIVAAEQRIRTWIAPTPLTFSPHLSELVGKKIWFKWENKLRTGSFKERGSANVLSSLTAQQRAKGVCTGSAGNHALGLSYLSSKLGISCHIVMPTNAPLVKVQTSRNYGAQVLLQGATFNEAQDYAIKLAEEHGFTFVPPYDHPGIVAGQGTIGLEILEQLPNFDTVVVPVGGGGLISGIATAIKARQPQIQVIGVQSEWKVDASRATQSGAYSQQKKLFTPVTIADGIAVKGLGKVTEPIVRAHVDQMVSVTENEIAHAIMQFLSLERSVVEGAGAAALAALLADKLPKHSNEIVVLVSGSNIDMNILSRLIERAMGEAGRLLRVHLSMPDIPGALHTATGIISQLGANILQVFHDRSFSSQPSNVDVTFLLEVKNQSHGENLIEKLRSIGIEVRNITSHE